MKEFLTFSELTICIDGTAIPIFENIKFANASRREFRQFFLTTIRDVIGVEFGRKNRLFFEKGEEKLEMEGKYFVNHDSEITQW